MLFTELRAELEEKNDTLADMALIHFVDDGHKVHGMYKGSKSMDAHQDAKKRSNGNTPHFVKTYLKDGNDRIPLRTTEYKNGKYHSFITHNEIKNIMHEAILADKHDDETLRIKRQKNKDKHADKLKNKEKDKKKSERKDDDDDDEN